MAKLKNRVKLIALSVITVPIVMTVAMIGGVYGSCCALYNGIAGKQEEQ